MAKTDLYKHHDYLMIDELISEENIMARDSIRHTMTLDSM